jgi:hypothetical protein
MGRGYRYEYARASSVAILFKSNESSNAKHSIQRHRFNIVLKTKILC